MTREKFLQRTVGLGSALFFMNGIAGIVQEKPYAMTQTLVSVAGLGLCYSEIFESKKQKLNRLLKQFFEKDSFVLKGSVGCKNKPDSVFDFVSQKQKMLQIAYIDTADFDAYVVDNLKIIASEIFSFAVQRNMVEGKNVRDAVLFGIYDTIKRHIPEFFKGNDIRYFIKNDSLIDVYALKLCHDIFQSVSSLKTDEEVFDYFKNGFQDKTSPFYDVLPKKQPRFLLRGCYQSGRESVFKVVSGAQFLSFGGMGAVAVTMPFYEKPLYWAAGTVAVTSLTLVNRLMRNRHVEKQFSRFETESFRLKNIDCRCVRDSEVDGYYVWNEFSKSLSSVAQAKIKISVIKKVLSILENENKAAFVKDAASSVFVRGILKEKSYFDFYQKIENGATLDSLASSEDLNVLYGFLTINRFVRKMRLDDEKKVHSLIFDLKMQQMSLEEGVKLGLKKIKKSVYKKLCLIDESFQLGEISKQERKQLIENALFVERKSQRIYVSNNTKLPRMLSCLVKQGGASYFRMN